MSHQSKSNMNINPFINRFFSRMERLGIKHERFVTYTQWGKVILTLTAKRYTTDGVKINIEIQLLEGERNKKHVLTLSELDIKCHPPEDDPGLIASIHKGKEFLGQFNLEFTRPNMDQLTVYSIPQNVWVFSCANDLAAMMDNYDKIARDFGCLPVFS